MSKSSTLLQFLKKYYKLGVGLVIVLLVGILGEVIYNMPVPKEKDLQPVDLSQLSCVDVDYLDGALVWKGGEALITLELDGQYIDKLRFKYDYEDSEAGPFNLKAIVHEKDGYGGTTKRTISDDNSAILRESVINIAAKADKIELCFDSAPALSITEISIDNTGNFSLQRFLFNCAVALFILIIIWGGKYLLKHLEIMFLIISLSLGGITILSVGAREAGLDEHTHFYYAYSLAYSITGHDQMRISPTGWDLMNTTWKTWPYSYAQSEDELTLENAYGNGGQDYTSTDLPDYYYHDTADMSMKSVGYLNQAAGIGLGILLGLPFAGIYALGRFANLLLYCVVTFFAIRHIKKGKYIMFAASLLPGALFGACMYTYDAAVNAFAFLAIAYIVNELLERDQKINWKNMAIFLVSCVIASCPKPVYIPLVFLALLLPEEKFADRKSKLIFRGSVIAVGLVMLGTFVLPTAADPTAVASDSRGGDTSVSGQMKLIFSHPWTYTKILVGSIARTFTTYVFGSPVMEDSGTLMQLGYRGTTSMVAWNTLLLFFAALTDRAKEGVGRLKAKEKTWMGILVFVVVCLVWTALYLSFTPVGSTRIQGVQGRYYLPVLVPILMLFTTDKIGNYIPEKIYNRLIVGLTCLTLCVPFYSLVVKLCF